MRPGSHPTLPRILTLTPSQLLVEALTDNILPASSKSRSERSRSVSTTFFTINKSPPRIFHVLTLLFPSTDKIPQLPWVDVKGNAIRGRPWSVGVKEVFNPTIYTILGVDCLIYKATMAGLLRDSLIYRTQNAQCVKVRGSATEGPDLVKID